MGVTQRASIRMQHFKAFFLFAFILPFVAGFGGRVLRSILNWAYGEECCDMKMVGDHEYRLIKEGDTAKYNCLQPCIYTRVDKPGSRYCFAAGDLEVTCEDDELEGAVLPDQ